MELIKIKPRFFKEEVIKIVEEKKSAKFVFESTIKQSTGWLNQPVAIFYTEEKHPVSQSNYFGLLEQHGSWYIVDGSTAATDFTVMEDGGDYYNSVFRHDCFMKNGNGIDGGRDYLKVIGHPKLYTAIVKNGEIYVV